MLKLENRIKNDNYLQATKSAVQQKRETQINIMRSSVDLGDLQLPKEEMCCQQCNTPVPLVCWRFTVKYFL